jgi:FkbM family methyltransferase
MGRRVIFVADDQPTFWDRVEAGRWEPGTLAALDRLIDNTTTLVDLGAWVGPTALYAAGVARRVIAVEADPAALAQLHRNLAANPDLAQRVEVVPRAIHPEAGEVRLGARRKPGDSMSSVLLAGAAETWTAATVTPENLARRAAEAQRLVIKIDIEGAEYGLLPHLRPLLDRAAAVLVSFHPKILQAAVPDKDIARETRAALSALSDFSARPVMRTGPGPRSFAPYLVRLHLCRSLPSDEWLFRRP